MRQNRVVVINVNSVATLWGSNPSSATSQLCDIGGIA